MNQPHEHQQIVWTIHDADVMKSSYFHFGKSPRGNNTLPTKSIVSLPQWREDGEMGFRQATISSHALKRTLEKGTLIGISPRKPRVSGDHWVGLIFEIDITLREYLMSFPTPVNATGDLGIEYFFGFVKDPIPTPVDGRWVINDTLCAIDIRLQDIPNGIYLSDWERYLVQEKGEQDD